VTQDAKFEFGDFQTPLDAAVDVVACLRSRGIEAESIVEPTCGIGSFLVAASDGFPNAQGIYGFDINGEYVKQARSKLPRASIDTKQFFDHDWKDLIQSLAEPVLILGNPPWVTSSGLSARGASNLPEKTNFQGHRGLDAKTGKANFDIAEWILIRLLEATEDRRATIAMLVKTAVARKVIQHAWKTKAPMRKASIHEIDAGFHFGVSVSACLLVMELGKGRRTTTASVFGDLQSKKSDHKIGWEAGHLVADAEARERTRHLQLDRDSKPTYRWRSGVKHDCSKVMELRGSSNRLVNGLGEEVDLEPDHVFPLMKGSDVARDREPTRWMLVPQRHTGDDTECLKDTSPKTWRYLNDHGDALDRRRSSIYRNRPRFSVFGIGDYTFEPWKVAICGLYKSLNFRVVGPHDERPVVFDDTVYHLSFEHEDQARQVAELLTTDLGNAFFRASIFWDNKRPVTAEVLNRLDLNALASDMGVAIGEAQEPVSLF